MELDLLGIFCAVGAASFLKYQQLVERFLYLFYSNLVQYNNDGVLAMAIFKRQYLCYCRLNKSIFSTFGVS